MNKDVWTSVLLSAFLSIPIGILCGLVVPPIQRWYRARGKSKATARFEQMKQDYSEALYYREHPDEFREYILHMVVRHIQAIGFWLFSALLLGLGISLGVFLKLAAGPNKIPIHSKILVLSYVAVGGLGTVLSGALFQIWVLSFVRTWKQVRDFESYVKTLPKEIRILNSEVRPW